MWFSDTMVSKYFGIQTSPKWFSGTGMFNFVVVVDTHHPPKKLHFHSCGRRKKVRKQSDVAVIHQRWPCFHPETVDTIRRAIPDPTTCGARPAQIPPKSTPLSLHHITHPPRSPSRSRLPPPRPHKANRRPGRVTHPPTSPLSSPTGSHPWPPPAASPRRSASPRCPSPAPASSPSPLPNAAPRFREGWPSGRRPAARARRRRRRSSRQRRTRQWDKVEDKYAVATIGVAAIVALWTAVGAIKAIDKLPLLPGVLELVGIGYTGWFTYRNLIFQPDREALISKIKSTYNEITGSSS